MAGSYKDTAELVQALQRAFAGRGGGAKAAAAEAQRPVRSGSGEPGGEEEGEEPWLGRPADERHPRGYPGMPLGVGAQDVVPPGFRPPGYAPGPGPFPGARWVGRRKGWRAGTPVGAERRVLSRPLPHLPAGLMEGPPRRGGGMHVGPGDPMFGPGRLGGPLGGGGVGPGGGVLPPGARWDPIAPPGMRGFRPEDFQHPDLGQLPSQPPVHPDIMQPGPRGPGSDPDYMFG